MCMKESWSLSMSSELARAHTGCIISLLVWFSHCGDGSPVIYLIVLLL